MVKARDGHKPADLLTGVPACMYVPVFVRGCLCKRECQRISACVCCPHSWYMHVSSAPAEAQKALLYALPLCVIVNVYPAGKRVFGVSTDLLLQLREAEAADA